MNEEFLYYYCIENMLYMLTTKQEEELQKTFPLYYSKRELLTDMLEWIERCGKKLGDCHVLNY